VISANLSEVQDIINHTSGYDLVLRSKEPLKLAEKRNAFSITVQ
jgi:hypothetical protein